MSKKSQNQNHSGAWVFQVWASFLISISATAVGIIYLPVDGWTKGFMGMGLVFTVGSTISLTKTTRDLHESNKIVSRLDEARIEKLLSEHNSLQ
ncbi:MAG: YiaA/YiaB family inner membrane protein [Oscillatoria sp. PMC 1068.18]|nr:YiaA/YiaB family inner membrane protein [Oscillatoria sp. PMC 1076.18]MEC4989123.1 YiaA/YiaB family inner membrane protein [Oscillatoria sp. PMC 1068.18]